MQLHSIKNNIKSVLLVVIFCYLPDFVNVPIVLAIFIGSIIAYRLLAEYYAIIPLPNFLQRLCLILVGIFLLLWQHHLLKSSGFYIGFFLLFTALKTLEVHTIRDLRVLVLCNFYVILTVLLLEQELWVFFYIMIAVVLNLMMMIKLTAPQVEFKQTGRRFIQHFLFAIPLSLFLFYLFPRLSHPLWSVPAISQAKIGFNEEMTIRNFSEFFNDDSTVMRIVFNSKFKPTLYWRGLVLSHFNGWSWRPENSAEYQFEPLQPVDMNKPASYEIMLEPLQKKWLFYQDNPVAADPSLMYSPSAGLVPLDNSPVLYRMKYSLVDVPPAYQPMTKASYQENTSLPTFGNLKLKKWAQQQYAAVNNNLEAFIGVIARRINHEPYWYSLVTENVAININLMDKFWFETKRGYCEYYTGAVAIILRAVGIPARVILGYHGGKWNPLAQYLTVQQNDAHAWLEYWQDGVGWQRLDPVGFIDPKRIDHTIQQKRADEATGSWFDNWSQNGATLSWLKKAMFLLQSVQFFWERWLLFYNADTQRDLLQKIGLQQWDEITLLQAFIVVLGIIFVMVGAWYLLRQQFKRDALLEEYHHLQHDMAQLTIQTQPPATFARQLQALAEKYPQLKAIFHHYIEQYEGLRLQQVEDKAENRKAIMKLFRALRKQLKKLS